MSVFITLTTDNFADVFAKQANRARGNGRAGTSSVRRPLRGLEVKEDTYAILKVIRADGTEIKVADSSTYDGKGVNYANFILQMVRETRMEKSQIVETFGEPYIFFFGEQPRFLDVQAVLINSNDFNWQAEWWDNYNRFWRGTKLVEQGARIYLFYDNCVIEGYMMQSDAITASSEPFLVQMQFKLFLTNYSNISLIGDPNFPVRSSAILPPGVDLTDANAFAPLYALSQSPQADILLQQAANLQMSHGDQFASYGTLNDLLRQGLLSTATYPGQNVDNFLAQASAVAAKGQLHIPPQAQRFLPLRGLIVANVDEWTGAPPPQNASIFDDTPDVPSPVQTVVDTGNRNGAKIDDPKPLKQLGMMPKKEPPTVPAPDPAVSQTWVNPQPGTPFNAPPGDIVIVPERAPDHDPNINAPDTPAFGSTSVPGNLASGPFGGI